jgi:hypothetical protein
MIAISALSPKWEEKGLIVMLKLYHSVFVFNFLLENRDISGRILAITGDLLLKLVKNIFL